MPLRIRVLPASPGDSLLITYEMKESKTNILIDGGIGATYYDYLMDVIEKMKNVGESIDLLIVTHVDYDHIEGICRLFEDDQINKEIIKRVWFNSGVLMKEHFKRAQIENAEINLVDANSTKMSIGQGESLEKKLSKLKIWERELIITGREFNEFPGIKIKVLSPSIKRLKRLSKKWEVEKDNTKEMSSESDYDKSIKDLLKNKFKQDTSVPNGSSIAILLEYQIDKITQTDMIKQEDELKNEDIYKKVIFAADAFPSEIVNALLLEGYSKEKPIEVEVLKVAHHGSKANTNKKLLDLIKCNHYIISSDASTHGLPNKECFARIIDSSDELTELYFNYDYVSRKKIFSDEEYKEYNFKCYEMEEGKEYPISEEVILCV